MSNTREVEPPAAGRDPFTLPTDTTFRFALLLLSIVGATLFIHLIFYYLSPGNMLREIDALMRISAVESNQKQGRPPPSQDDPLLSKKAIDEKVNEVGLIKVGWAVCGQALLFGIGLALFHSYPRFKLWRDKLRPLTAEDATTELAEFLSELCRRAGVTPAFVWNPLNRVSTAVAFGRRGRYYVALSGGLVTQFFTDRAAFRAVLLHELAHIRNADVGKTYFTIAVWRAFLLVALLPASAGLVWRGWGLGRQTIKFPFQVLTITLLVYLTRNAVLRAREVYADLRAARWEGPDGALGRVLMALPNQRSPSWKRPFNVHPSPSDRHRALADQRALYKLGLWTTFGAGLAIPFALSNLFSLLVSATMAGLAPPVFGLLLICSAVSLPVSVVVVLGVWRATLSRLNEGHSCMKGTWPVALTLGLGLLLGNYVAFSSTMSADFFAGPRHPTAVLVGADSLRAAPLSHALSLEAGAFLLAVLYFVLFTRWVAASASVWLTLSGSKRLLRASAVAGVVTGALFFALALTFVFSAREIAFAQLRETEGASNALVAFLSPFLAAGMVGDPLPKLWPLLVVFSLWAFPLSAGYWLRRERARAGGAPPAEVGSHAGESGADAGERQVRPLLAAVIGAVCGLLFWLGLVLLNIVGLIALKQRDVGPDDLPAVISLEILLSIPAQALAAAITAFRVRRWGTLHGLCAAFAAACVIGPGIILLTLLFWGTAGPEPVTSVLATVVLSGVTTSALASALSARLARWVRSRRRSDAPAPEVSAPRIELAARLDKLTGGVRAFVSERRDGLRRMQAGSVVSTLVILFFLGRALYHNQQYRREMASIERYKKYLQEHDPAKNYALGTGHLQAGNYKEAAAAFQDVVSACEPPRMCLKPSLDQALLGLGYAHLQMGMLPEAVRELTGALEFDVALSEDERARAHSCLGQAYEKTGRYEDAIDELSEAVKLAPEDDEAVYHLGAAYAAVHNRVLALKQLETLKTHASPLAEGLEAQIARGGDRRAPDRRAPQRSGASPGLR